MSESGTATSSAPLLVSFQREAYSVEAIKRAAYALMRDATVDVRMDEEHIHCTLFPNAPTPAPEVIMARMRAEALDQALRESIARETEKVRVTILALAFSRSGLAQS